MQVAAANMRNDGVRVHLEKLACILIKAGMKLPSADEALSNLLDWRVPGLAVRDDLCEPNFENLRSIMGGLEMLYYLAVAKERM